MVILLQLKYLKYIFYLNYQLTQRSRRFLEPKASNKFRLLSSVCRLILVYLHTLFGFLLWYSYNPLTLEKKTIGKSFRVAAIKSLLATVRFAKDKFNFHYLSWQIRKSAKTINPLQLSKGTFRRFFCTYIILAPLDRIGEWI